MGCGNWLLAMSGQSLGWMSVRSGDDDDDDEGGDGDDKEDGGFQ